MTAALTEALRPSLRREQHILVVGAAVALSLSVAAIRSRQEIGVLVTWFVGCAVLTLVGIAWYRHRIRVCANLIDAIENGAAPSKVAVARFTINYIIPFGYLVNLDAGALKCVTFGFWRRATAERFVAALAGTGTELPRARVT